MIQLTIKDRDGREVKQGDWVNLFAGRTPLNFFGKVEVKDGILHPFETVCFNSFVKIDTLPDDAIKLEGEHNIYRNAHDNEETDATNDMHLELVLSLVERKREFFFIETD